MDNNNRKSYLKLRRKWHLLSRARYTASRIVSFQDDKETLMQNFKTLEVEN